MRRTAIIAASSPRASTVRAQSVADAADRLERLDAERPVDLLAQVAHVHVDDVRAVSRSRSSHARSSSWKRVEHLARAAHEDLEQRELLRREATIRRRRGCTRRVAGIEPQIAHREHRWALAVDRARDSARRRAQQLGER